MIPIYKPYMPENLMPELNEILYSGQLSFGKYGKQFESKLKDFIGCEYVLTTNSYNSAMLVVLSTLGLEFGDEVIASPVSCLASNQPLVTRGLKVVWADINPKTGTLCPDDVEAKITEKTRAIFHNHFCGYVGEIDALNYLGEKYCIPVIDDGIEGFGAEYNERKLGNVGTDYTVFSFQAVRLPNTIEGGAITFKSRLMYDKAKLIRDYGIDRTIFRDSNGEINAECDIVLEGYGALMNEVSSFIGLQQMNFISNLLRKQQENGTEWKKILSCNSEIIPLLTNSNSQPNFWVFGTLCKSKWDSMNYFKSRGITASGVHLNNNMYSVFGNKIELKGVEEFMKKYLAIPCGWWINDVSSIIE
jgi:perosamine synthetase